MQENRGAPDGDTRVFLIKKDNQKKASIALTLSLGGGSNVTNHLASWSNKLRLRELSAALFRGSGNNVRVNLPTIA